MTSSLIDLTKKAKISLEKKAIVNVKAQVVLVLDISYSMSHLYDRGTVQNLVNRLLGIGMNMDDNQSIEVFIFGSSAKEVGEANEGNHQNYVQKLQKANRFQGGTEYANPMKLVLDKFVPRAETKTTGFFRKKTVEVAPAGVAALPTFVFFVTDGDNSDKKETEQIIRDASDQAIFWQFVGLGNERFAFLQQLDDMDGRFLDNVDFFHANDLDKISDEELYDRLLNEFPEWVNQAKEKGILQ